MRARASLTCTARAWRARAQVLYARLWHALLLGDADGIRAVSVELGVGEYYPLLAAMLTGTPHRPHAVPISSALR